MSRNHENKRIQTKRITAEEMKFEELHANPCDDCDGRNCKECEYSSGNIEEQLEEKSEFDSGFFGSMLEAHLIRDGSVICEVCGKPVRSVLDKDNPNTCMAKAHEEYKRLFDVRIKIGLQDLKTRGYD